MECDYLVVGCGLFGCVLAERIATVLNKKVIVVEKRDHIAGNCYSEIDSDTGIEIHSYGTHIFHTSSRDAWEYISKFTKFNHYHHQVLTVHNGKTYQMPINLETINSFYNLNLNPSEAREFLQNEIHRDGLTKVCNLEDKAISSIGRPLYEAFIKEYTEKQWGCSTKKLPASIINRLPVRYDYREDYFLDAYWQGLPVGGYTRMFEMILNSPNIEVLLNCDFFQHRETFNVQYKIIYSGPVDRLFNFQYGKLEWRSVELKKEVVDVDDYQGTAVMNFADREIDYTRVHEFKHLHPERPHTEKTVICYERTNSNYQNPSYPVTTNPNKVLYSKYKKLVDKTEDIVVGGRLGSFKYYDMDKVILAALSCFEEEILAY